MGNSLVSEKIKTIMTDSAISIADLSLRSGLAGATINVLLENTDITLSSHQGEEFLYVLNGAIGINYGKETYELQQGDSIYYDSIVDHLVSSANHHSAKILAVVYTPF